MRNSLQHFSTSTRKSVKGFIVLLFITCYSFGYEPGSIKGKYKTNFLGYVYQCIGLRVAGYHYWREEILSTLGSIKNVFQSCIPSAYVDNSGTLHTLFMSDISSSGPFYEYRKCIFNNGYVEKTIHPWSLIGSYSLSEHPYLETFAGDNFYFKNYIHNILLPKI